MTSVAQSVHWVGTRCTCCVLSLCTRGCSGGSRKIKDQSVGGVLTHSWLPCGRKEEMIILFEGEIKSLLQHWHFRFIQYLNVHPLSTSTGKKLNLFLKRKLRQPEIKRFDCESFNPCYKCKRGSHTTRVNIDRQAEVKYETWKPWGRDKWGSSLEAVSYLTSQQTVRESRKWKKRSGRFFLLGELLLEAFCARRGVLVKGTINVVMSRQTETSCAICVTAGLHLDLQIFLYIFLFHPLPAMYCEKL